MKQKAAAFLAVCMTVGSLPAGSAAAVPAETNGTPEDSNVAEIIEFDPVKLKDAMDQAVKNDEMVTPPTVVASSSDITGFSSAVFELKDAEKLLVTGSDMPDNTDVRIFLAPESEGYGEDGEYSLTGNESMIFMVENQGGEDQGYQLLFGNRITDVIEVKSKDRLLAEYYNPEDLDKATDSDTATPSESEAFETESGEDPTATGSETVAAAERSLFDRLTGTMVSYGAELKATASESGEFGENGRDEAEVPSAPAEENTEDEKEPSLPQETVPETEAPQESVPETEETQESRPEAEAPAETAPEIETEAAEEEEMNHFTAYDTAVDENGYVRLSSGEISSSLLVVKNSFDKVDAEEGMDEPMAIRFAATKRMAKMANEGNSIALMSMDDEAETVADSKLTAAAFFVTTAANVLANGDDGESPFTVNLYDYAGDDANGDAAGAVDPNGSQFWGSNWYKTNNYLEKTGLGTRGNWFGFGAIPEDSPISRYRGTINAGNEGTGYEQNIYQGIPDIVGGKGKLVSTLFPDSQPQNVGENIIKVYPEITVEAGKEGDEFFQLTEDGTYSYNSSEYNASYDSTSKTLKRAGEASDANYGFWPFGGTNQAGHKRNNFFGMSLKFDFYKPADGKYGQNDEDMIFSFSGDDDVWVYITNNNNPDDSKLVLDIGGNHGRMDGTINFATGEVVYSNKNAASHERDNRVIYNASTDEEFERLYDENGSYSTYTTKIPGWGTDFMKDGEDGNYTLEFYYLERGGISNCQIQFKLPVIPKRGVTVSKRLSGKLTDAIRENYYNFIVAYSNNFEDLNAVRTGEKTLEENEGTVSYTAFSPIQGAGESSLANVLEKGQYFYIEEADAGQASNVSWAVSSSGNSQVSPVESTTAGKYNNRYYSAIYQVPDAEGDTGFLFLCTNEFGSLNPTVKKQAWKDKSITDEGVYDIVLEVTGDEIQSESSSGSSDALNVVFVMDKSQSISRDDFQGMKDSIVDVASGLSEGSQVSIIAFAADGNYGDDYGYDDPRASKYYQNVTSGWVSITGKENDPGIETIKSDLRSVSRSGNTHTAAGLLGAEHMIDQIDPNNQNPKVVIFMTDGAPNTYVGEKKIETYKFVGAGNGNYVKRGFIVTWYEEVGEGKGDYIKETSYEYELHENGWGDEDTAKDKAIEMLKKVSQKASVYTISYKYSSSGSADDSWMKVESGNGVKGYYKAENIDQLKEALIGAIESETTSEKVKNPVVTDVLSDYVEVYEEASITDGRITGPKIYLQDGSVSPTNDGAKGEIELLARAEGGELRYYVQGSENEIIATYDPQTKTIVWNVADSLGENETKTLTVRVKVSDQAEYKEDAVEYPDAPEKVSGASTGTHDREKGYFSNKSATLTYDGGEKDFDKPVVQPVQSYTSLTLKKEVNGDYPNDWSFRFKVAFSKPLKDETIPDPIGNFYVYEKDLSKDNSEVTIPGVPIGAQYEVWEVTEEAELDEDYTVTDVNYRVTSGQGTVNDNIVQGKVGETAIEITCTNTIEKYNFIRITKTVSDSSNVADPDTEYEFSIYKDDFDEQYQYNVKKAENGIYISDPTGTNVIKLKNSQSVQLRIEPEDKDSNFYIVETDSGKAWKTTYEIDNNGNEIEQKNSNIATVSGSGDHTVDFTNYYYNHSIILTKEVDGEELQPNMEYPFTIEFTVEPGKVLTENDFVITAPGGSEWILENNKLTGFLSKDENITISELPQYVTGYKVTENNITIQGESYEVVLKDIKGPDTSTINKAEKTAENEFNAQEDQTDKVIYINQYEYQYGYLKINKWVTDDHDTDAVFTFKITNTDTNEVFFTTIKGKGNSSIQVPIGTYKVEEVDSTARYEKVSVDPIDGRVNVTKENTEKKPATVTFTNQKTTDSYFSDVSTVVNTVDDGKFKADPTPDSLPTSSPQLALQMNAGAFLLPGEIRMQPNDGDEMIQPA